ncbi:argininosuccinate lyase [Nocardioides bruguierae]|uniref:Argininosuccinate lyase n=1 Tax=Nocardioides bruguierae TaxID=2945102 RepID=A0A9X2D9J2_9ACTN|nr:argininosuccinate lyase [Nocardioides bruguierae]MCM0621783.1 argininosuccinate lyase [Nocardioides bruguierae]
MSSAPATTTKPHPITEAETAAAVNPLWGGRFSTGADALLVEINSTVHFDHKLAEFDLDGSQAHVRMLASQNLISQGEGEVIRDGLEQVRRELADGTLQLDPALEDVHMNIESRLREIIGPVAGRMHIGRSRNDQVAVDSKLWTKAAVQECDAILEAVIAAIVERATEFSDAAMPGFTHLQCAQPVTLGHHLLAYGEMFLRDRDRLLCALRRMDESPLGAAALAGTGFDIDPFATARDLGFERPARNSIDAVSDRDYMLDVEAAASICGIHMSRLGEELVNWSAPQFGYAQLPEGLTAGSSIMPQKRNPDAAELIRAKSGRMAGALMNLLMVMKALPLAYNRDTQEDKEPFFDCVDTLNLCLRVVQMLIVETTFNTDQMSRDARRGNANATDLADWLVTDRGLTFRDAHHSVGQLVRALDERGFDLVTAPPGLLGELNSDFAGIPTTLTTLEHALSRRTSFGGTAPDNVRAQAAALAAANSALGSDGHSRS